MLYAALSSASTAALPKAAVFFNDTGDSAKTGWSLTNVTNTATGGTALQPTAGGDLTLSGFDTASSDFFTYRAADASGTSGAAVAVTVQRVASANLTGGASGDILIGSNTAGALSGGGGNDYIVGGTGADTITGGAGADDVTGGGGADTYVFAEGADGVGPSAVQFAGASLADGDRITFANGVDIVRGFTSGTDKLDLGVAATITTLAAGAAVATALTATANYQLRGNYDEFTHVFTVSGTGADLMVVQGGGVAPASFAASETDFVVLVGVTAIAAGDVV